MLNMCHWHTLESSRRPRSIRNRKPARALDQRDVLDPGLPDEPSEVAVLDLLQEGVDFLGIAGDHEFHSAVRQVANRPGHIKPGRYLLGRVAEPDPLDPAFVCHALGLHG